MSYKIYGDGEIWKDGKVYAKIYSDGEIWQNGKPYAKVYDDGEIWKDNRKIGKVYDDGEVYIDNRLWGKIYTDMTYSTPKKEEVYTENKGFGFGIPTNNDAPSFSDIGLPGFGIFAVGFIILLVVCSIAALFMGGLQMWKAFTIDTASYGFTGIIAAILLAVGAIYGIKIQLSKLKGGVILGLIVNTIIIMATTLIGQFITFGSMAFEGINTDVVSFVGAYVLMAAFPTAVGKILTLLGIKFDTTPKASKPVQPKNQTTQPKTSTTSTTMYKTNTTYTTSTPKTSNEPKVRKGNKNELAFDELAVIFASIKNGTFESPSIWDSKMNIVLKVILAGIIFIFSVAFLLATTELRYFFLDYEFTLVIIFAITVFIQYICKFDYIKGLGYYAIIILVIFIGAGIYDGDVFYYITETFDEGNGILLIASSLFICFGLSYIGCEGENSSRISRYKKVLKELEKEKQTSSYAQTKTETCIFCGNVNRVPVSFTVGQATTCDKCKAIIRITK